MIINKTKKGNFVFSIAMNGLLNRQKNKFNFIKNKTLFYAPKPKPSLHQEQRKKLMMVTNKDRN